MIKPTPLRIHNLLMQKIFVFLLLIAFAHNLFSQTAEDPVFLTMEEALSRALSHNNQLRASEFGIKKATWDKRNAWTMLFPTAKFNTRFTWIDDSSFTLRDFRQQLPPELAQSIPQTVFQESYVSSFDFYMPIFNGRLLNGLSIAGTGEKLARQQNESTRNSIIFRVIGSYLNVVYSNAVLALQKDYLNLSQLNFDKAERMHQAGRYSKMEALRWKVDYQQQKSIVSSTESGLRSARAILARTLNMDMNLPIQTEERVPDKLLTESEQLRRLSDDKILDLIQLDEKELLKANAALAAAKSNEKISKLMHRNDYSRFMPEVSLTYSYSWWENNTIELDDYSPQTLIVNFSLPLFNSFQDFAKTKSSYYDYKRSQEQFSDQLQNTRYTLTETVNKILNLKTQIELSKTNVEYNEHNYKIVSQQKEEGLVSNIDFIDAKLNLQNARLTDLKNQFDIISAMVELYYLTGNLDKFVKH